MQLINKCRSCKSKKLFFLFTLGKTPFSGIFPNKLEKISYGDLSLVLCKQCSLVQLDRNFSSKKMYGLNYGYRTGLNPEMVNHMKKKANFLKKYLLKNKNTILDIGANDGTLLNFFEEKKFNLFGIDPTIVKFKKYYNKKIKTISNFFSKKNFLYKSKNKADLIITNAMLYDLKDPYKFIKDIRDSLDDNGIWHTEQSYIKLMLENNSYDTICHEHIEYYSLKSLKYLFDKVGFKIISINVNDVNGGSLAITLVKKFNDFYKEDNLTINKILDEEHKRKIYKIKTYKDFFLRIKINSKKLITLLKKLKNKKKIVLGYGASTKGNIILSHSKINSTLVPYIAEVNSFKYNKLTPGSNIKIISEDKARKINPNYFLVLPWHFKKFICEKEKKIYAKSFNRPKLIFPLPKLHIV